MKRKKKAISKKRTRKPIKERTSVPIVSYPDLTDILLPALKLIEASGFGISFGVEPLSWPDSRGREFMYAAIWKFDIRGTFRTEQMNLERVAAQISGVPVEAKQ